MRLLRNPIHVRRWTVDGTTARPRRTTSLRVTVVLALVAGTVAVFATPAAAEDTTCYTAPVDSRALCFGCGSSEGAYLVGITPAA
jgi:hypothetical protein